MRILFISLLLPHPTADHAGAFTVFKVIQYLSQRHDLSLISYVRSSEEGEMVKSLQQYCRKVETVLLPQNRLRKIWVRTKLLTLTPIVVSNSYCEEMRGLIRTFMRRERFDVVQVEYSPMGQYVNEIAGATTILSIHDLIAVAAKQFVEHLPFSRKKLEWYIDSLLSCRYENQLYPQFDRVLAISEKIKESLLAQNPLLNISVLPPGVDIPRSQKRHVPGQGRHLIFMGAMWRSENIDAVLYFYRSIFHQIRKTIPEATFTIVGGSPSEEVKNLASDPSIRVTGYVEDLLPYYMDCDVSVAPVRIAGGVMCKILDAMAAGLPVITTSQGNEGIDATPGEEILVADTAREFAESTIELLQNEDLRKKLSQKGSDFIRRNFTWEKTIMELERIYQNSLS